MLLPVLFLTPVPELELEELEEEEEKGGGTGAGAVEEVEPVFDKRFPFINFADCDYSASGSGNSSRCRNADAFIASL